MAAAKSFEALTKDREAMDSTGFALTQPFRTIASRCHRRFVDYQRLGELASEKRRNTPAPRGERRRERRVRTACRQPGAASLGTERRAPQPSWALQGARGRVGRALAAGLPEAAREGCWLRRALSENGWDPGCAGPRRASASRSAMQTCLRRAALPPLAPQ